MVPPGPPYGQRPPYPPPHPPHPPGHPAPYPAPQWHVRPKSPLTTIFVVIAILSLLGGGTLFVIGALVYFDFIGKAASDPSSGASTAGASTTGATPSATSPTTTSDTTPPEPPSTGTPPPAVTPPLPLGTVDVNDDGPPPSNGSTSSSSSSSSGGGGSSSGGGANVVWMCNATGWVRVCGFANVCNNQMVSGIGSSSDRFVASQSAKLACEGMARAKGGSTVCAVSCSPKSR